MQAHIVRVKDQATGTAFICVSDDAENAITIAPGANFALRAEHLPSLAGVSHLLLQLEIPMASVTAYARAAQASGVKVVLNAAPAQPLSAELLALVDVLIVNQGELAIVANGEGSIAQRLTRMAVPCVVVTLGRLGCCARMDGALLAQTAFEVAPIDTTGAGDTFCGVLVAALSLGHSLLDALRRASAAGALACTRPGAQSGIPTQAEVDALLAASAPDSDARLAELRQFCGFVAAPSCPA